VDTVVVVAVGIEAGGGGGVPVPLLALSDRLMSESSETCEKNFFNYIAY